MKDPTDAPPPPSYQMSVEEFDQKTSNAMQLASSTPYPVDEDGWPIYDPAAFDAAAESYEHPPSSSSSTGFPGSETSRQVRLGRPSSEKAKHSTRPTKARLSEQHILPEDELASEDRSASPPPPFTATGPSLDGPPFEEVVTLSYHGTDSLDPYPRSPQSPTQAPPMLQPVEPLRLRSNRTSSNRYPSHQQISPRPNLPSGIARVEFDPQMAYSPYSGVGNHTSIREGALAFYNHAVASQLMTNPTMTAQTQSGHTERPYSSGYTSTPYWAADQVMSSVSLHEQTQSFHSGAPAVLPPPPPPPHLRQPSRTVRGPLPPVPTQPRWAGSETQIVQDVYGGHG